MRPEIAQLLRQINNFIVEQRWDIALNTINRLLVIQEHQDWLAKRGLILIKLARWDEAIQDFEAVLKKEPNHLIATEGLRHAQNKLPTRDFFDLPPSKISFSYDPNDPTQLFNTLASETSKLQIEDTPPTEATIHTPPDTPQTHTPPDTPQTHTPPDTPSTSTTQHANNTPSNLDSQSLQYLHKSSTISLSIPQPSDTSLSPIPKPELSKLTLSDISSTSNTAGISSAENTPMLQSVTTGIPSSPLLPIPSSLSTTPTTKTNPMILSELPVLKPDKDTTKSSETPTQNQYSLPSSNLATLNPNFSSMAILPTRYEIHAQLGIQGPIIRYQVYDCQMHRFTLVKTSAPGSNASQFLQVEANLLSQLQHTNITRLYEANQFQNSYYLVMEWIEGKTLAQWIKENPLTLKQALTLMHQLTRTIEYLHQNGILHRHICPEQIMVSNLGNIYLDSLGQGCNPKQDAWIGQTWIMDSQIIYSAPEVARGFLQEANFSTDVYSLGAILYELLTGRKPFHGNNLSALLLEVLHQPPPPPTRFCPLLPSGLESICLKAMSKQKQERYQNAGELAVALEKFITPNAILMVAPKKSFFKPAILVIFTLLLLGLLGWEIQFYDQVNDMKDILSGQYQDFQAIQQQVQQDKQNAEQAFTNAYQLNTKWEQEKDDIIALQDQAVKECNEIRIRYVDELIKQGYQAGLKRCPISAYQYYIKAIQEGGKWQELSEWRDLTYWQLSYTTPYFGKAIQSKSNLGNVTYMTSGPDGQKIAIAGKNNLIWQFPNDQTILIGDHEFRTIQLEFHPNKPLIAAVLEGGKIVFSNYDLSVSPRILSTNNEILSMAFRNDGEILATVHAYTIRLWDMQTLKLQGELKESIQTDQNVSHHIRFSPNGRLLILASDSNEGSIQFWDCERQQRLKILTGYYSGIAKIQCVENDADYFKMAVVTHNGVVEIWKCCNDGTSFEQIALIATSVGDGNIAWSSGGKQLYTRDPQGNIWIWEGDQGNLLLYLPFGVRHFLLLSSSPERLATLDRSSRIQIWELPLLRYNKYPLPNTKLRKMIIHPTNEQMMCTLDNNGQIMSWDIQNQVQFNKIWGIHKNVADIAFSPDGKQLLVATNEPESCITSYDWENTSSNFVVMKNNVPISRLLFSPDKKILAVISDKIIQLFEWPEIKHIQNICSPESITTATFSLDQQVLAVAAQHQIQLWNMRTYQLRNTLTQHTSNILALAFSPDRDLLASTGYDQTIVLWNWKLGKTVKLLQGHTGPIYDLAFINRPENALMPILVSAGNDNTIRLWHIGTCQPCDILSELGKNFRHLAIANQGEMILFGGDDPNIYSWNMKLDRDCFKLSTEELRNKLKDW